MPDFQGLTAKALTKHPPLSVSMIMGFLDQQSRKNQQRSTKPPLAPASTPPPASDTANNTELSNFPLSDHKNECTHHCFAAVFKPAVGKIHTNQWAGSLLHRVMAVITSLSYMTTTATASIQCVTALAWTSSPPSSQYYTHASLPPACYPCPNTLTMNAPQPSRCFSSKLPLPIKSCSLNFIAAMLPNVLFACSRIILLPPPYAALTKFSASFAREDSPTSQKN